MKDYAMLLKNTGLKATFQRMTIVEQISKHGHISIEGIYDVVVSIYPSISLATVYKNILLMIEKGVLVEVPIAGKKSKYELAKKDHIHLVCTSCGEVEDQAHQPQIENLFHTISKKQNFTVSKQQVNLYGICDTCQIEEAS
jgi:Fe2+ or Zn2+ uptake regulation protein